MRCKGCGQIVRRPGGTIAGPARCPSEGRCQSVPDRTEALADWLDSQECLATALVDEINSLELALRAKRRDLEVARVNVREARARLDAIA